MMTQEGILTGRDEIQKTVIYSQKVMVDGIREQPDENSVKRYLTHYLHSKGIDVVESTPYGYNWYTGGELNLQQVPSIYDTTVLEDKENCILFNIMYESDFLEAAAKSYELLEITNIQDSFMEAYKPTRVINLIVLNQTQIGFAQDEITALHSILKRGERISYYADSVSGIVLVDKLIDECETIIDTMYGVTKGTNVIFGEGYNTNIRLAEKGGESVINGIWFE